MPRLICVPPDLVNQVWPLIEHHIRKALQRGGMGDYNTVAAGVLSGPDLLWLALEDDKIHAVAITSLSLDGICTIVACGGAHFSQFGHLIAGLEQFAKNEGCKAVRICGRPGWLRLLSGYRTKRVIIEKAL